MFQCIIVADNCTTNLLNVKGENHIFYLKKKKQEFFPLFKLFNPLAIKYKSMF